jgi:hypothetical protein
LKHAKRRDPELTPLNRAKPNLSCSHVITGLSALAFCSKEKLQQLMEVGSYTGLWTWEL